MKLKPCPFCGGEAQINERYRSGTPNRKMYWVSCKACGISQQHDNTSGYRYRSKAIEKWNRRKPMEEIITKLESHFMAEENIISMGVYLDVINIVKGGAE